MKRWIAAALGAWLAGMGCDGLDPVEEGDTATSGPESGATPGTVVLLVDVDPEPLCNTVGVVEVQLVATRTGCESAPPAPCTLPADPPILEGDRFTCPNTDPSRLMGVEVDAAGRYTVQSVIEFTDGQTDLRCHAQGGDPEVLVTAAEVDAGAVQTLDDGDVPCP